MKWTHDALQEDLAQYVREKTQRMVWTNMQLGPVGSPRPDAYSVAFSFSRFTPLAYEVKVSTSDFRRDVTAGKWQSYLRFASAVTFAVPVGLVGKEDIPSGCGLMVRSEAGWRTVKAPTLRAVENLPLDAWLKLLMDGLGRIAEAHKQVRRDEYWLIQDMQKRFGNEVSDLLHDRRRARHRYEQATSDLEAAAKLAEDQYRKRMDRAREDADRDAATIDSARRELAEALGLEPDARAFEIAGAARAAANRLEQDAEVQRLERLLKQVRQALDAVDKPMPAIARAA